MRRGQTAYRQTASPVRPPFEFCTMTRCSVRNEDEAQHLVRGAMLKTSAEAFPYTTAPADDKRMARINVINDLLVRLDYNAKDEEVLLINPDIVLKYSDAYIQSEAIAP